MSGTLSLTFDNSAGSLQVRLPIIGTGVTANIDWGDTTTDTGVDPNTTTHTYPASGYPNPTAVVTITSSATSVTIFGDANWPGVTKLTTISTTNTSTWGLGTSVTDFSYLFYDALLLTSVPSNIPSSVISLEAMFLGATLFNQNISNWDVSNVTNMGEMFAAATTFDQYIRTWAVQPTTTLADMFNGAAAFQTAFYPTIPGYNTSNNTPLYTFFNVPLALTFGNTPGLVTIPIDVSGVAVSVDWGDGSPVDTSLSHTYSGTGPFTASITITSGTFTHFGYVGWLGVDRLISVATSDTTTWGLGASWGLGSSETSFANLFDGAFGLISVPTNIPPSVRILTGLFIDASTFNQDISSWNVSNVTYMVLMFAGATSFNQDISDWDVGNVVNTSNMFDGATAFNNGSLTDDEAHPLDWNTESVIVMSGMFANTPNFNQYIGGWNVTSATTMEGMFLEASLFNQNISGWNMSNVVNTKLMFSNAVVFNKNIGAWDVGSVVNMESMFEGATAFNGDISGWDISNVTNMSRMFMLADSFNQNISGWNVGNVTNMGYMFYGLYSFNLDISEWDVSSVLDMQRMFYGAQGFNRNISGWDVSSVTNMTQMFTSAIIFNQNIRIWSVGAGTDLTDMFDSATAFQARFYPTTPGYNTDPNEPLYTFFNVAPPPPPPTPSAPVLRLPVGGGGGSFWFGREGFLFKGKGGGGARRSTKMAPGGNTTCNGPTYIYNKYNPGNTGVGAQSTAVRRAKNIKAAVCGPKIPCGQFYNYLGLYDNYTGNPNGYFIYPRSNF